MSYDKVWEYDTTPHRANSKTLKKILLGPDFIINKLNQGEDPINLSILKWNKIKEAYNFVSNQGFKDLYYNDMHDYIGSETCALCIKAIENYEEKYGTQKYMGDKCKMCELALIEPCTKTDSLYSKIAEILDAYSFYDKETHLKLGKYIDEMILRIQSLLFKPGNSI